MFSLARLAENQRGSQGCRQTRWQEWMGNSGSSLRIPLLVSGSQLVSSFSAATVSVSCHWVTVSLYAAIVSVCCLYGTVSVYAAIVSVCCLFVVNPSNLLV